MTGGNTPKLRCRDSLTTVAIVLAHARFLDLLELRGLVTGPEDSIELHNLRIGAKKLRYSLEMFSHSLPGDQHTKYGKHIQGLQEILGRIHDLDVLHTLLADQIHVLDGALLARVHDTVRDRATSTDGADDPWRELAADDEQLSRRVGLVKVIANKLAERQEHYDRFVALWEGWEESGTLHEMATYFAASDAGDVKD